MSNIIWLIVVIAALVVLAIIAIALLGRRSSRLRPLPEGARTRYAESWRALETRFVDAPQQAVSEADGLVVALYRERGGSDRELPGHVREARDLARREGGDSMTENLRRAMQEYRSAVEDLLGSDPRDEAARRPEVAS